MGRMLIDDPTEIASMRATLAETFTDVVDIEAKVKVSNGQGGRTETWQIVTDGAEVPCRRAPAGQSTADGEPVAGSAVRTEVDWVFTLPSGTPIKLGYRLNQNGRIFNVSTATFDRGTDDLATRVFVTEVGTP